MFIPILAVMALASSQSADSFARSVLEDVCLPYVTGEATDTAAADFLGFVQTGENGGTRQFATADEAWTLRLTTSGVAEDGDLSRICVLQARRGGLAAVRAGVEPVLRERRFVADAEAPADRPLWTSGGTTVSLRQNEGRAAVMRVSWSALDAAGG